MFYQVSTTIPIESNSTEYKISSIISAENEVRARSIFYNEALIPLQESEWGKVKAWILRMRGTIGILAGTLTYAVFTQPLVTTLTVAGVSFLIWEVLSRPMVKTILAYENLSTELEKRERGLGIDIVEIKRENLFSQLLGKYK